MLILLSPAKSLDFSPTDIGLHSIPEHLEDTQKLVAILKRQSETSLSKLMNLSPKLAALNVTRYQRYEEPLELAQSAVLNQGAKQSLLAFDGDVYRGFRLETWSLADFEYAQDHLRILSGLYGTLRPMDLILPHRLEMGTALRTRRGKNLYAFWGARIAKALAQVLNQQALDQQALDPDPRTAQAHPVVLNLASNEYFSSVDKKVLSARVVSPRFEDWKTDRYKVISFFAKRARGAMANWVIQNRVDCPEALIGFAEGGYRYDPERSTPDQPIFLRDTAPRTAA